MGTMNIAIKDEAYKFLASHKEKNQSFSDVILGFKEKEKSQNILRFFGVLNDVDWKHREEQMKKLRKDFDTRL
jgi:predicted CopG family antitoxin